MFVWLQIFASFRNFLSVAVLKERERESQREKEREREREQEQERESFDIQSSHVCKKSKKSSQKIVLRRSNPAKTARLYSTTFSSNRIAPTQGASWADNNLLSMKNCTLSVFFTHWCWLYSLETLQLKLQRAARFNSVQSPQSSTRSTRSFPAVSYLCTLLAYCCDQAGSFFQGMPWTLASLYLNLEPLKHKYSHCKLKLVNKIIQIH